MSLLLHSASLARLHWLRFALATACLCSLQPSATATPPSEPASQNPSPAEQPITELREIALIKGEASDRPHPLHALFDVDFLDPIWRVIVGRNEGHAFTFFGNPPIPLQVGKRYLVEGTMTPSARYTMDGIKMTLLSSSPPLAVIDLSKQQFNLKDYENKRPRLRVEGYVDTQYPIDAAHSGFVIIHDKTLFHCVLMTKAEDQPNLVGKRVRFEGLLTVRKQRGNQPASIDLYGQCAPPYQVLGDVQKDSRFNIPRTPIDQLAKAKNSEFVKISGVLHSCEPGSHMTIRDETGLVRVFTPQMRSLRIGENIDAIGLPSLSDYQLALREGMVRIGSEPVKELTASPLLRLADLVLNLSMQKAAQGLPVKITGIVTWSNRRQNTLYMQDASGGIRVQLRSELWNEEISQHRLIELEGITAKGKFTPEIIATRITPIDTSQLPTPRTLSYEQATSGAEAGQWVELRGYVRDMNHTQTETILRIATGSGEFNARLPLLKNPPDIVGAEVALAGVCTVDANERGEYQGFSLLVASDQRMRILDPPPPDAFTAPERTIPSLRKFNPPQSLTRRIRLTGQVIHHVPGRFLYVQDEGSGLLALSRGTEPLHPGDRVELAGLFGREGNRPILRETTYRRLGDGSPLMPKAFDASPGVSENLDGCLAQTTGRLLEYSLRDDGMHFLVRAEHGSFDAVLQKSPIDIPPIGSKIDLTGVYQVEYDEYRQPRGICLLLRSPADLVVLATPSWWTTGRALSVAGLLFACIMLIIGWVAILRRRVAHQTVLIRDELEKKALLEASYRTIIDSASDFIFTLDQLGRITSFNPAGERLTGYTREQTLGRPFTSLLAPDTAEDVQALLDLRSENEPSITRQTRFKNTDGRLIWVEICARAHRQPGLPSGILAVARDISDRKLIEDELLRARDAAEANTRAKSAFLANMSHEIRTPMNGVIGMSNLLLHDPRLMGEHRDYAETIRNSAESLLTVLNDILDFSKIEAGKLQIETIDFNLHEAIESTLEMLAARALEKQLEFTSFLSTDLPCTVRGDPGRLRQILINLLGNALKFTERGEVVLNASLVCESEHEQLLRFEVADTGPGLDIKTQNRLFLPFIQADDSTTRKHGGTGLGLAISRQIVHLMQGEIGVHSTPGQGATFWFTVHLGKPTATTPREKPADLQGRHALLIDENTTRRKILQHYCTDWNLRTTSTASTAEALTLLQTGAAQSFQVVIANHPQRAENGLSLANQIHLTPGFSKTPILLLTAWDQRLPERELADNGITRLLVKPVRRQDLLTALQHCLAPNPDLPAATRAASPPTAATEPNAKSLRILVAEDNIVNQRVAALQLQRLGHTVEIAANGHEVLKALEARSFDVIMMDCQMPEMDGYEATRRIRQIPALAQLHIIAMTANAMQGDRERCLAAGMDDYVSKPTRSADLQAALLRGQKLAKQG